MEQELDANHKLIETFYEYDEMNEIISSHQILYGEYKKDIQFK